MVLKRSHVVWERPTREDHLDFACLGCGNRLAIELPVSLTDLPPIMRTFERQHADCWRRLLLAPAAEALAVWNDDGGP